MTRTKAYIIISVLLCLAYSCQPTSQAADIRPTAKSIVVKKMRIVGPNEVMAGDLVELNADVPDDAGLDWAISPPEASSRFYVDTNKRTAVFASRTKGVYIFALAVATNGEAHCLIHVLQNGVGPGPEPDPDPDPEPDPDPDPTPEPGKRFVLVVSETGERTAEQASTLMGLRDYLQTKKHDFRFIDPDFENREGERPKWFDRYAEHIEKAEIKGPALVIGVLSEDGKTVVQIFAQELPVTAAAAIEAVKAKGG